MLNTELKKFEPCKNPDPPYAKTRTVFLNITVYLKNNKHYVKGSMIVLENLKGYNWRFKEGSVKSGAVKYKHDFKKMTCKSFIPKLFLSITNTKYNMNTCEIFKGVYNFDVEFNSIQEGRNFFPITELGSHVWLISLYGPNGTSVCCDIDVEFNVKKM